MSYRTKPRSLYRPQADSREYQVEVHVPKKVLQKGSSEPMTVVSMKRMPVTEYAKSLGLPKSEDYQLRDMLAAGQMPEMVKVSGMLDSQDPTDLQNVGVADDLFSKLAKNVKSSEPAPEPTPEPTPEPEPSKTE